MYYNIRNTFWTNLPVDFLSSFVLCTYIICLCFLCIVICMHSFHLAHIFKVCNSVIWPTHSILNYGHIVKLCSHCVYSPLNSYVYIHWILDFKYIIIIIKWVWLMVENGIWFLQFEVDKNDNWQINKLTGPSRAWQQLIQPWPYTVGQCIKKIQKIRFR